MTQRPDNSIMHTSSSHAKGKLIQRLAKFGILRVELLQDVVDAAKNELSNHDIPPTAAELVAHAVADRLAENWGGQSLTFPRDHAWNLALSELLIYDQWVKGVSLQELTRQTGMTERGIRKVLERIQKRIKASATNSRP